MKWTSRGALISVAVLAVGVAVLAWWLIATGQLENPLAENARKNRTSPSESRVTAASPEKPAAAPSTAPAKELKNLGDGPVTPAPARNDPAPTFDVARVEPDGEAVIAGRAVADSSVELLVDGRVHDRTTADSTGAFVFVPKPLPPGNYGITLRATTPDGKVTVSKSSVAVALQARNEKPVAALAAPKPPAAPAEAPKAADAVNSKPASKEAELRVETVKPEEGGGLLIVGRAAPGSKIRLYLNDGYIAMGTASPEGRIAFSIGSGVRAGDYRIRLDQMNAADALVSRAEVPFRAPATLAAPSSSSPPPTAASPAPSETIVASRQPAPEPAPAASPAIAQAAPPEVDKKAPLQAPASSPGTVPSVPAAAVPAPKDVAEKAAQQPLVRSAEPTQPSPSSPVAGSAPPAPSPRTEPQAGPDESKPAGPNARAAQGEKKDAPAGPAQSPVMSKASADPKSENPEAKRANNVSPRIADLKSNRDDTVVIPSIDTKLIIRGDNLWRISRATYGFGQRYTVIFRANRDKIRDPDLIYPGQIFVLPKSKPGQ